MCLRITSSNQPVTRPYYSEIVILQSDADVHFSLKIPTVTQEMSKLLFATPYARP